ncbi:hypothetical protein ACQ1Z4_14190, partial [Enterococcus faecalis]|uniref:hypothetical protein n=1 Tax=Enterococcus faecalis TaxID=1351 RepID=UPI003D6C476D
ETLRQTLRFARRHAYRARLLGGGDRRLPAERDGELFVAAEAWIAARLAAAWADAGAQGVVTAVLGPAGLLGGGWTPDAQDIAILRQELANL